MRKSHHAVVTWKLFVQKKMEDQLQGKVEVIEPPEAHAEKTDSNPEPKFCDNEETFEGYGRQKVYQNELAKRQNMSNLNKEKEFFQSLTCAFGPQANDILPGNNILDILTLNFSGMDQRDVCKRLLKLAQNSLQSSASTNSPGISDPTRDSLLRLREFLISYLKQDLEGGINESFDFDFSMDSRKSPLNSSDSFSSLGILDVSDMSSIIDESFAAAGDQSSMHCDVAFYLNEIEELQHQNKKLGNENLMFKSQITILEDTNQLLSQNNVQLKKEVQSLIESQRELKELHSQNEHLKSSVSSAELYQKTLLIRVNELEKEKRLLEENIKYLGEKLSSSQCEANEKQKSVTKLTESLLDQKVLMHSLRQEKHNIETELSQKNLQCKELESAVSELTDSNQSLRKDKNLLEVELGSVRLDLQRVNGRFVTASEQVSSPAASPEMFLASVTSTPVNFHKESLCAEMNDVMSPSENLPTPFCGKKRSAASSKIPYLPNSMKKYQRYGGSLHNVRCSFSKQSVSAVARRRNFSKQVKAESNFDTDSVNSSNSSCRDSVSSLNKMLFCPGGDGYFTGLKAESQNYDFMNASFPSYSDTFLRYVLEEIQRLQSFLENINSQAKHALKIDLDLAQLEKKLLEAKGESLGLVTGSKAGAGDSSMPPQAYSDSEQGDNKRTSDASSQVIREQISAEIKALKTQLIRSHALLSYLQEKEKYSSTSFSPDVCSPIQRKSIDSRHGKVALQQQKSLDAQTTPYSNYSQKDSLSNTSHRSTPLHTFRSQSCPLLMDEMSFASKSTQTELQDSEKAKPPSQASSHRFVPVWNRVKDPRFSECSSTSEVSSKSADNLECGVCEVHPIREEPNSPCLPRHRTNSFLSAVVETGDNSQPGLSQSESGLLPSSAEALSRLEGRRKSLQSKRVVKIAQEEVQSEKNKEVQHAPDETKSKCPLANTGDRIKNDKEKFFKTSQRSMRRGSGAGSPNSLTSIPRFPAFDLDEQDEDNSLAAGLTSPKVLPEQTVNSSSKPGEPETPPPKDSRNQKEIIQGKHDYSKAMLMPEAVENSETESAKGSFEYESSEAPVPSPPIPVPDMAFPNLPNTLLMKLGITKESSYAVESFDEQELESKFMTLSLAFKTDKMTLSKRLEIQKRQRDIAEKDVENEIRAIKDSLKYLNLNAITTETRDLIAKIQTHVDIVSLATSKVSARSETYGAVKQEERVSCAFEVMMHHVENLRRLFDKEHRELEDTKRMLDGTSSPYKKLVHGESASAEEPRRSLKTVGIAIGTVKSVFSFKAVFSSLSQVMKIVRRRASVADFHQHGLGESIRSMNFSQTWSSGFKVETASRRISALLPFSSSSSVGHNSTSSSTHTCTPIVQSLTLDQASGSRRCSLPASPLTSQLKTPLDDRVKDVLHLGKTPNELKISVAPSLSSVADEENSGEEDSDPKITLEVPRIELAAAVAPRSKNQETPSRPQIERYANIQDVTDSSDDSYSNSDAIPAIKENDTSFRGLCVSSLLHFWNETSGLNLLRYGLSLFLAIGAFVVFVATFLPSDNCSLDDHHYMYSSLMTRLRELLFRTSHSPPIV